MQTNATGIQTKNFELKETTAKMEISALFADRKGQYLNEFTLFLAHFNTVPNFINEVKIDCKKANKWFAEFYKNDIQCHYCNKRYYNNSKEAEYDDLFYFLYDDLLVDFDTANSVVRFLFNKTSVDKVEAIIDGIKKFKEKKAGNAPKISLLINTKLGIDGRSFKIKRSKINIAENYNDDFRQVHNTILKG